MQSEHAARDASALPRHIGWFTAGCVLVSNVVGSGIFTTTGFMARDLGHPGLILSVWLTGALIALAGALTCSELGAALPVAGSAQAASNNGPYPHDFKQNNMGYCAPYLAQLRLPDGSPVRPFINHTVQQLTAGDQSWLGYDNPGDFASSKAQSNKVED